MNSLYQLQLLMRHKRITIAKMSDATGLSPGQCIKSLRNFSSIDPEMKSKIASYIGCDPVIISRLVSGKMTFLDYLRL